MIAPPTRRFCCRARTLGLAFVFVAGLSGAPRAGASGLDLFMDNVFSGTAPSGSPAWVEASFQDASAGTVMLTITNLNITSSEKVTQLYLNLNPSLNPGNLQFTLQSGSSGVTAPQPSLGVDSFKADGDGKYDILFGFSQTPASAFSSADYLTYSITGIPTLTSSDFDYLSSPAGGNGPFEAAIHVQGIDASGVTDTNSYSGWVSPTPVPEPSSGAVFVLAASVAGGMLSGLTRARQGRHSSQGHSSAEG